MNVAASIPSSTRVLVLQGGGALGAYQAGIYEALSKDEFQPDWVAGISIGGINAAIIAGNPPDRRLERLREFWELVSSSLPFNLPFGNEQMREVLSETRAAWIATFGVSGFFKPRVPPALLQLPGTPGAMSFYDTEPLRETLERLVDFDLINAKQTRLSLGAANVQTSELRYFDNTHQKIGPEHVMASGALPPGFPPIEIDGQYYWDGGVVSNTPLEHVLDCETCNDLLIFQVDLFNAHGPLPKTVLDALDREKDIHYASRTIHNTQHMLRRHEYRMALRNLLDLLPEELRDDPNAKVLHEALEERRVSIVQFVYRNKPYEGSSKDYEFSRQAMIEHWQAGIEDAEANCKCHREKMKARPATPTMVIEARGDEPKVEEGVTA